mgnify:FL=1|jgi:uncharacterized damage-inducible protein DinB
MKVFFKEIFEYHNHINQSLMESIKDNNDMLKHIIPLLSHSIIAHQNWNATILNTATSWANELISLEECIACDNQNFQTTLRILNENELEETVEYVNAKQVVYKSTVLDVLFHVSNHFSHHRGQIVAEIRKGGIDPIITDFIYYKR